MAKVYPTRDDAGKLRGYAIICPGCGDHHEFRTVGPYVWQFDGNKERPTFTPSMKYEAGPLADPDGLALVPGSKNRVCHSFVRAGYIEFLGDCTHEMRGKTVELPEIDPVYVQDKEERVKN